MLKISSTINHIPLTHFLINATNSNYSPKLFNICLCNSCYNNNLVSFFSNMQNILEIPNDNVERPLHIACKYSSEVIVKILIEHNAEINLLTKKLQTPLHLASIRGDLPVIQLLIDNGADIYLFIRH